MCSTSCYMTGTQHHTISSCLHVGRGNIVKSRAASVKAHIRAKSTEAAHAWARRLRKEFKVHEIKADGPAWHFVHT